MLFTHSLGLNGHSWENEAAALSRRYHVVQIDTRGHGASDAPAGPYTLDALGADVLAVADHLRLDRFHAVGLSLGGLMTQWLAVHHAGRLLSATYCNTAARLGGEEIWNERIEAVAAGMDAIVDTVFPRFFTAGFASRQPAIVERIRKTFLSSDPGGYAGCCAALRDADLRRVVQKIEVPSLIIAGAEDVATPPDESRWLHGQIRGSKLAVIEGAAHLSNVEQPELFGQALATHLAGG